MEEELRLESAKSRARRASINRGLVRFAADRGYGTTPGVLGDPDVIEAFLLGGLGDASSSTRGTYRSVLGGRAGDLTSIGFRGSVAKARYSGAEVAELLAMAGSQRHLGSRRSALAMLVLTIGAGLSVSEVIQARVKDVAISDSGAAVAVTAGRIRVVPISPPFDGMLAGLGRVPEEFLFREGPAQRSYKNFVTDFASSLVQEPNSVRFSVGRARATFVCGHLESGTSLGELLVISGIKEVESLLRYCHQVPRAPKSKSGLRRALAGEGT